MWFRELLPGWGNRPLQEGGLGRFRFLVLVVYIFGGDEGRRGRCDGGHEWLAGQEMGKLIVSGGGEVGGLMQSGDDSTGDNRSINR